MRNLKMCLAILALLLAGSVQAATLTVCPSGCRYSSIQAAVDASRPGDTIEVHSGGYNEQVLLNKDVTLKGIDTGGGAPVVKIISLCGHPGTSISGIKSCVQTSGCEDNSGSHISCPGLSETQTISSSKSAKIESPIKKAPSQAHESISAQKLLYSDDFSDTNSGWSKKSSSPEEGDVGYKNGKYQILVLRDDSVVCTWVTRSFRDFIIEVEATQEKGPDNSDYGIILRRSDLGNYYRFKISGLGYYGFDKKQSKKWNEILPWTRSAAIKAGRATNLIKVECEGDKFTFYVNGIKLRDCIDNSFASGDIGLIAGTHEDSGVQISFDNMKVWSV